MPVLFRTIYACGLRCSEARLLRVQDVDIDKTTFERNRERIAGNTRPRAHEPGGAVREGSALLQGIAVCGRLTGSCRSLPPFASRICSTPVSPAVASCGDGKHQRKLRGAQQGQRAAAARVQIVAVQD